VSLGAALGTAAAVTLTRPATWALALAAFLIRGGIVWFLLPIIVFPTAVGLANAVGPTVVDVVLGGPSVGVIALMTAGAVVAVLLVVLGGLAAAAIEVALIAEVATDEEVGGRSARATVVATDRALRVLAVRMIALAPLAVAVVFATTRIVAATYGELTLPSTTAAPIGWRVASAVPDAIGLILLTWILGEIVGAIAARRVVLGPPSVSGAVGFALGEAIRHPLRTIGLFGVPAIALLLVLVPSLAAVSGAWVALRTALADGAGPVAVALALAVFVGLWVGGLILTGVVAAWRQAAWTVDAATSRRGTFGGSGTGRPGDWNPAPPSGTL